MKKLFDFIIIPILVSILTIIGWHKDIAFITYLACPIIGSIILLFNLNKLNFILLIFSLSAGNQRGSLDFSSTIALCTYIACFIFVLSAIKFIKNNKPKFNNKVVITTYLMLLAMILSLTNTPSIIYSINNILKMLSCLAMFIFIYSYTEFNDTNKNFICYIMLLITVIITFQMGLMYFDIYDPSNPFDVFRRKLLNLSWEHSNHYVMFISMSLITTIYLFINSTKLKPLYVLFILLQAIVILLTLSRGAILGLAICAIPIMIVILMHSKNIYYEISIITLGIIFLCFLLYVTYEIPFINSFINRLFENDYLDLKGRDLLQDVAIDVFKDNMLFGGGAGSAKYYIKDALNWNINNYHHYFFQALAELGIIGVLSFTSFVVCSVITCIKKDLFAKIVLIIILYFLGHGLVDTAFFNYTIFIFMFIFVAFVASPQKSQAKRLY